MNCRAPPLYAGRHLNLDRVAPEPASPTSLARPFMGVESKQILLSTLNTDPNNRVAAGLGAEYVRLRRGIKDAGAGATLESLLAEIG